MQKLLFFCRGDNAEKHHDLLDEIKKEGHTLGNHTYSHINSFYSTVSTYINDVEKADEILHTKLFRPPWGSMTIATYLKLIRKYKIVYWDLASGDTNLDKFKCEYSLSNLQQKTKNGSIVLFHCCIRHGKETRKLLPKYLDWLYKNGYNSEIIKYN